MKHLLIFLIALMICTSSVYSQKSGPEYIEEFKITVTGIPNDLWGNPIIVFKSVGNLYKPQSFSQNQPFYPVE